MRKNIAMPNGEMWIEVIEGEVLSQQKWSETLVRGSGGGGYISQGSGAISDVNISSSSTEQLEFWVKGDDGRETAFRLADSELALRAGQRVRIARGGRLGTKRSTTLLSRNHASGETHALVQDWLRWALAEGLLRRPLWYRLLSTWLPLLAALLAALVLVFSHKHPGVLNAFEALLEPAHGQFSASEWLPLLLSQASAGGAYLGAEISRALAAGSSSGQGRLIADLFGLLLFVLFAWGLLAAALKLVGRLVLRLVWKRAATREVQRRVLAAFEAAPA